MCALFRRVSVVIWEDLRMKRQLGRALLTCSLALACSSNLTHPGSGKSSPNANQASGGVPGVEAAVGGAGPMPTTTTPLPGAPGGNTLLTPGGLGFVGMGRLSKQEYQQSLVDLLGVAPPAALAALPEDILTPFDNDYASQVTSAVLISGLANVAREAATSALSTDAGKAKIVPCTPTGPSDAACFTSFIQSFGQRALHRPLGADEVNEYLSLQPFAVERNDFYAGVALVVRAMLQDIEFVYRVEVGTPVSPGLVKLTPFELANRMSFTLLGTLPNDALLDIAKTGGLDSAAGVRTIAQQLLTEPRAVERIGRFHAQWLNYDRVSAEPLLKASMRAESDALLNKVLFQDRRPWDDVFTSDQAFVDARLAPVYGLPPPATPSWVKLTDPNRRGLLGQANFLAGGAKFGDTSPVLRGLQLRQRLMCQTIPSPPPGVSADQPPAGSAADCKATRYAKHAANPCATCHALLDPVGNGFEQYGADGKLRAFENNRPECPIEGKGELTDMGISFSGPAGLVNALMPTSVLNNCVMQQLFQYVVGRQLAPTDRPSIDALAQTFTTGQHHLPDLLVELVASPAFQHRVTEVQP